jgi:DNA-binding FadR family transcriptional regulator
VAPKRHERLHAGLNLVLPVKAGGNMARSRLLSTEVAQEIKNLIISKQLKEGDKLPNELELSENLGVSRITIREAIKQLSSLGALEIRRGVGTFVSDNPGLSSDPLGLDFLEDETLLEKVHQVRLLLEPQVCALAALQATDGDIAEIERLLEQMHSAPEDAAGGAGSKELAAKRYADAEIAFHLSICACCRNDVLERIMFIIMETYIKRYWDIELTPKNEYQKRTHQIIVDAIKERDPEKARQAATRHLEFAETIIDLIRNLKREAKADSRFTPFKAGNNFPS